MRSAWRPRRCLGASVHLVLASMACASTPSRASLDDPGAHDEVVQGGDFHLGPLPSEEAAKARPATSTESVEVGLIGSPDDPSFEVKAQPRRPAIGAMRLCGSGAPCGPGGGGAVPPSDTRPPSDTQPPPAKGDAETRDRRLVRPPAR